MRATLLFVPFCALTGSLALPQTITGSSVSLPGVDLSPADQTACIQSCSQSVAQNRPDALDACLDTTGNSAPNCLCTDATLAAEMQKCFGARCPPLQGRCAAILGGSSFVGGTTGSAGSPGQSGTPGQSSGSVSFPDVQLPPAQQTACVQSCSDDVADNEPDALDACLSASGGSGAAKCLCTDATLASEMQKCFGARCAPLQGRCAAIDSDGGIFIAGTSGSTGVSTSGTSSGGTSAPGGAGTSSPGTVSGGTSAPGSAGAGTPGGSADGAAGASGSSSDNGAGANSPSASAPGDQPAPESGVPESSSGASPSAAGASPSAPSSAADDDVNPDAGNLDNSAGANGVVPLALALSLAVVMFL